MSGRRVLVVEDTTTTGVSPIAAIRAVREAGGEVVAVATIADRATGAAGGVSRAGGWAAYQTRSPRVGGRAGG